MNRNRISLIAAAVTALVAVTTVGSLAYADRDTRPDHGELQSELDALVESEAATAALLRVESADESWATASGTATDAGEPADPAGYFRIGSITKTFVATVVAQLVDEGLLDWDEPVDHSLPGVVPDGEHITVRQLLNHTSGLYDYMHEPGYSTNRWRGDARFEPYEPSELLDVAFAHDPYFPPGGGWHYSNTNYVVLGELIAAVSGQSYADEVRRRILEPLELSDTVIPGHDPSLPEPHAHGYADVDGQRLDATEMDPSLDGPAGEMVSTTGDLARFFETLLSGRLTSDEALEQMRDTVDTGTIFGYGLGLQRFDLPCERSVYGHSGQLIGYTSYVTRGPDGTIVALSLNPTSRPPDEAALMSIFETVYCG